MFALFFSLWAAADPVGAPKVQPIDVQSYSLKLELDPETNLSDFRGRVEIELRALETSSQIILNAEEMTVQKVYFSRAGKKELTFRQKDGKLLEIDLEKPIQKGRPLVIRIEYTAKVNEAHYGLFKVTDPDDVARGVLFFTQLEAEGARRFFPCNDIPSDKAITEIEVATRVGISVVSNGRQTYDRPYNNSGQKWHRVNWRQGKPHSTYLVALAVAPLAKISLRHKGLELSVNVGSKKTAEAQYLLKSLPKLLDLHEAMLKVKYPWDKYAVVGVPTFLWGGMENTSATFQNEARTLLIDPKSALEQHKVIGLAAHELAHQWFGDLVTLNWWDDIWLNEAFATYIQGQVSTSFFNNEYSDLAAAVSVWEDYFRQEDGPRSHPIVEKNKSGTEDAFDAISYQKGANVLKTLEVFVGEESFKKGLTDYLKKYSFKNATHDGFFEVMAKASGENLDEFKKGWIFQRGYPVLSQEGSWNAEKKAYTLQLRQRSNHADDRSVFRFRMPVVFHRTSTPAYHQTATVEMGLSGSAATEQVVGLLEAPEWITLNPRGRVLVRLDSSAPLTTLERQMNSDPDPLTRLWAAREVAKPLFQGKTLNEASEALLSRWLQTEPSPYVRATLLVFFQKKYFRFLPEKLGATLVGLAEMVFGKDPNHGSAIKFESSSVYLSDPEGWRLFQAEVLGTLGKVPNKEMLPFLATILGRRDLSLDDTAKASIAVAQLGSDQAGEVLKVASKTHSPRGHAYRNAVEGAYGAWENPKAAAEIRLMAKSCGQDLPSRWARLVKENNSLMESAEWSLSLKDILLTEDRLGEEVKARLLSTVEELATENVFQMASEIRQTSKSERLKAQATKMIKKNFPKRLL